MNPFSWLFPKKKKVRNSETPKHSYLSFFVLPDKSVDIEIYFSSNETPKQIAEFLDAINSGKFVPIVAKIIGDSENEQVKSILYEWSVLIQARKERKIFIPPSEVLK